MKLYILASLIIFIWVIAHNLRKSKKLQEKSEFSFWEKERLSNETRRKSLDDLEYIQIPLDSLPMQTMPDHEEIASCIETIRELSMKPVVNLTGLSNTDLKLKYGTANITALMEYDQSYTLLAATLQKWAKLLYQEGLITETISVLEFAISTHTDVTASYDLLADLYIQRGDSHLIDKLFQSAETLNSLSKDIILRHLKEKTGRT